MKTHKEDYELVRLWLLASDGGATETDLEELNKLIESDAGARQLVFELTQHQGWLKWHGIASPSGVLATLDEKQALQESTDGKEQSVPTDVTNSLRTLHGPDRVERRSKQSKFLSSLGYLAAIAGVFVLGMLFSHLLFVQELQNGAPVVGDLPPHDYSRDLVHGKLIDSTVCVWSTVDGDAPLPGQRLVEGDSFQLLEGIATFALEYGDVRASIEVEGPAALMLARGGIPNLRYGKVIMQVRGSEGNQFPIETSFGRVLVSSGTETGVASFGSKAQIHVFNGDATVESAWIETDDPEELRHINIPSGGAIFLSNVGGNSLVTKRYDADRQYFTPSVSMRADHLIVPAEYVDEIERAAPVAYWRFEGVGSERISNHMSDKYDLTIHGEVNWIGPVGNQAIEFGMSPTTGFLTADESWEEVLDGDLSVEFWAKPSHYHYGALVGFVGKFIERYGKNTYGIGIELGGAYQGNTYQRVRQVRAFHRAPTANIGGPSILSGDDNEYKVRRWQHITFVLSAESTYLYLDGQLCGSRLIDGPTPRDLKLLIGQLYTKSVLRPYVGDLDEVAVYDRALSPREIKYHYHLLRPSKSVESGDLDGAIIPSIPVKSDDPASRSFRLPSIGTT